MEGQEVVTTEDQKLGTVIAERDNCVIIESGHLFKSKHAIPLDFLHDEGGVLRATVGKDVVADSPKVDIDNWDVGPVRRHYGLDGEFLVDPDPDGLDSAETAGARQGVNPAPADRIATLGGVNDPAADKPLIRDRMANANDPTGVTANLSDRNRTGD
ncbi:MAG: hypothetical protein H0X39_17810 [Actinobacteria bacterium]|nr:hypothetical protein [Actinomycetota bacterium]